MPLIKGYGALADIPEERINDKITRKVVSGNQGMMVWWNMKAGSHATPHSHPHEQLVWIIKGRMDFRIGKEKRVLGPGDVAVIPGGVEHEAFVEEDVEALDTFAPPREDFLQGGTPHYMRKP
jgi:quercetin dioxygenase-like cupin family protein